MIDSFFWNHLSFSLSWNKRCGMFSWGNDLTTTTKIQKSDSVSLVRNSMRLGTNSELFDNRRKRHGGKHGGFSDRHSTHHRWSISLKEAYSVGWVVEKKSLNSNKRKPKITSGGGRHTFWNKFRYCMAVEKNKKKTNLVYRYLRSTTSTIHPLLR